MDQYPKILRFICLQSINYMVCIVWREKGWREESDWIVCMICALKCIHWWTENSFILFLGIKFGSLSVCVCECLWMDMWLPPSLTMTPLLPFHFHSFIAFAIVLQTTRLRSTQRLIEHFLSYYYWMILNR